MPVRKVTTDERNLGRKALDGALKVLSFLPLINEYNIGKAMYKEVIKDVTESNPKEFIFKTFGRMVLTILYVGLGSSSYYSKSINPKVWKIKREEFDKKTELYLQNINQINSNYNNLFKNAANFEDSLRIYQENNLEKYLEFNEPSFEDKERVLEGRVE